jgi:hypothetical protein
MGESESMRVREMIVMNGFLLLFSINSIVSVDMPNDHRSLYLLPGWRVRTGNLVTFDHLQLSAVLA